jgi:hypothetical protein
LDELVIVTLAAGGLSTFAPLIITSCVCFSVIEDGTTKSAVAAAPHAMDPATTSIRSTPVAALQNVLIPSPHSYWYLLCPYLHKEIIKINSWISQSSNIPAGDSGTERL